MEHLVGAGNLSRLLQDIRLAAANWIRLEMRANAAAVLPAGDHFAAHLVIRGSIQLQVDDKGPLLLEAGQTAILPQGRSHVLRESSGGRPVRVSCFDDPGDADIPPTLQFGEGEDLKAVVLSAQLRFSWPTLLPQPARLPVVLLGTRSYNRDATAALAASRSLDITAGRPGATACLSHYAHLLLTRELCDFLLLHPMLIGAEDETSASMVRAIDAVQNRPEYPWTVERLANYVGMSRSTFAARFSEIMGSSPIEMVTQQRMEIASKYLRNPNMRIKAIAGKVGYISDTAFLRRFHQHFGMSPKSYRKKLEMEMDLPGSAANTLDAGAFGQY